MRHLLKSVLLFLAALVILFEEWLWEPLRRMMLRLSQLPGLRRLAAVIAALPPRAAMALYLAPMVMLFPFKIGGLWLIGRGHAMAGLAVFLAAKVVGTALFAWLFGLTRAALLQIGWFARAHAFVTEVSEAAHGWLHRQPFWQMARNAAVRLRSWVRQT